MSDIKEKISKRIVYCRENLSFTLTLIITYVFLCIFVFFNWEREILLSTDGIIDFTKRISIIMDNLIPTTVVYILGCLVNNMIEIMLIWQGKISSKSEHKSIICNIFTLIFLPMYVCFYCVYIYHAFSVGLFIFGILFTILLVILNFNSYKEMHPSCIRSIS